VKLVHPTDLVSRLSSKHLFLDTNVLIHANYNAEFYGLLADMREGGCELMITQSVVYEFVRGSRSIDEYNKYVDSIRNMGIVVLIDREDSLEPIDKEFTVELITKIRDGKKGTGFTDFELLRLIHKFKGSALMTANYKDVPLELFSRGDLIALEFMDGVQTQALYYSKK